MNYLYFDSSALAKRYYEERGTDLIGEICQKENIIIVISDIAVAELGSAFARKLRERNITDNEYELMLNDFVKDCLNEYLRIAISFDVLILAIHLAKRNSLKASDAIQLACAIDARETIVFNESKSDIFFVVADDALEKAANFEGFKTINPNTYDE